MEVQGSCVQGVCIRPNAPVIILRAVVFPIIKANTSRVLVRVHVGVHFRVRI